MRPSLTTGGKSVLATAGFFLLGGVIVRSWPLVSLGGVALCMLLAAMVLFYPRTILLGRRKLEVAWWIPPSETAGGALLVGNPFGLQLFVRNRSPYNLGRAEIDVLHSEPLQMLTPNPATLIRRGAEVELKLQARSLSAGHWFFYGVTLRLVGPLGLYQVIAYYPLPLTTRIFPRFAPIRASVPHRPRTGTPHERSGRHPLKLRGLGGDLREIRDHQHGDPFKSIAWKATARTGKLMVREYESEIMITHFVVLDISWSMRAGDFGASKLDYGIDLAASFSRWAIEAGDRVGLVTFDSRVYSKLKPSDGRPHLAKIVDRLMELRNIVDEDLTNLTQGELVRAVAEFMLYQDGVNVRVGTAPPPDSELWERIVADPLGNLYDWKAMSHWVDKYLDRQQAGRHATRWWRRVVAASPQLGNLRRFCQLRGINLPYRSGDDVHGSKDAGLADAVAQASLSRGSQFILLISDLEGITVDGGIMKALAMARKKHHHPVLIVPNTPLFGPRPVNVESRAVADILRADEERRTKRLRREVEKLGIPVLRASPDDALMLLLSRLARLRRLRAGRG
ncbi:MAG: DUF58 domain-containing protein [bacterium]